jgi:anti-sigma regulatory factor (Ser/Thr protein kinase)
MRSGSLERPLQWTLGLLVLLVLLSITAAAVWIGRESAQQFVASRLSHDADAIVAALAADTLQIERAMPPVFRQPFSGHYFTVRFDGGGLLPSRSLWDEELAVDPLPPGETRFDLRRGPEHQRLLVWQAGYKKRDSTFTVAVAEDINPLLRALRRLQWIDFVLSLLTAVVLLVVQRWLLRRGFSQIDAVRADIRRLSSGEIKRLREEVPVEVQPLVREVNQLIGAWQQHVERSRNALGNLLDNAAKRARQRVRLRLDDGPFVRIAVEDDGPGVDIELANALLTRGTRLDETLPGHGLGLAIVGDIVRHYGGHLRFGRSQELGGLAVVVELPVAATRD